MITTGGNFFLIRVVDPMRPCRTQSGALFRELEAEAEAVMKKLMEAKAEVEAVKRKSMEAEAEPEAIQNW